MLELSSTGDKITCPAFDLYESNPEMSTAGHLVLDLAKIKCRPKGPTRTITNGVTFAAREVDDFCDSDEDIPATLPRADQVSEGPCSEKFRKGCEVRAEGL